MTDLKRSARFASAGVISAAMALAAFASVASATTVQTVTVQSGSGTIGGTDPNVTVTGAFPTRAAAIVAPGTGYSTIAGTNWDSVKANGLEGAGTKTFVYQASISIPANAVNPTLSGRYYSDNQGTVLVNGNQVAINNACDGGAGQAADYGFGGGPAFAFSSGLTTGANALTFSVFNCGPYPSPTGVDFTATASYTLTPTSLGDCKNGGWQNFTDTTGASFTNQGDCVSYVATGGRNPAAG